MGLLDIFNSQPKIPQITSILPAVAQSEILRGCLPILKTNKIFLKNGEVCHYIDKAIYEKRIVRKRYVKRNNGMSMPGLFKGTHIFMGGGHTDVTDNVQYEQLRGILYITTKRIIFVSEANGFDKKLDDLVAVNPFANCVELQFSKEIYKIFVPNGNVVHAVLQQLLI